MRPRRRREPGHHRRKGRAGNRDRPEIDGRPPETARGSCRAPSHVRRRGDPSLRVRSSPSVPARRAASRTFSAGTSARDSRPRPRHSGAAARPAPRARRGSSRARPAGRDTVRPPACRRFDAGLEPGRHSACDGEGKREDRGGGGPNRLGRGEDVRFPDRRLVSGGLVACGQTPSRQGPHLRPQRRNPDRRGGSPGRVRCGRVVPGSGPLVSSRGAFRHRGGGPDLHPAGRRRPARPGIRCRGRRGGSGVRRGRTHR